jgi:transcriptional regulator with XRE-family HTH domain
MRNDLILNESIKKERATFGERLKELRGFFECTQAEIAEIMGVVPTTVIAYEKNQKNPSIDVALRVAEHFNISLDWLCGFTEKMTRIQPMTYADILKILINIMNCKTQAFFVNEIIDYDNFGNPLTYSPTKSIDFKNVKIQTFLNEFAKMHDLLKSKTIDEDLFNMWIEKQLKQYDGAKNRIIKAKIFNSSTNDFIDERANLDANGNGISLGTKNFKMIIENGLVVNPENIDENPNTTAPKFEDISVDDGDDLPF